MIENNKKYIRIDYDRLSIEQKKLIQHLLKLGLCKRTISTYMNFNETTIYSFIKNGTLEEIEYNNNGRNLNIPVHEINDLIKLRKLLESGNIYTRELVREFPNWNNDRIRTIARFWNIELKISRPHIPEPRYRMIKITPKEIFKMRLKLNEMMAQKKHTNNTSSLFTEIKFMKIFFREFEIYKLVNMGADFLLKKGDMNTLVEIKTSLNSYNCDSAIVQLLFGKDKLKSEFNIETNTLCIYSNSIKLENYHGEKRFLNHFNIECRTMD